MSGRKSRTKGANYEREIARLMQALDPEAQRGLGQPRNASEVADVDMERLWVETKRHKRVSVPAAVKQAVDAARDSGTGKLPVVVHRDDRDESLVTMRLEDWLTVVVPWWHGK